MPSQAYYKKSAHAANSERESSARPRPESCSSVYSLYDENDIPPEIQVILSMSKAERYPPRSSGAIKTKSKKAIKKSKFDGAVAQEETERPGIELSKPKIQSTNHMSLKYRKQDVITEELCEVTQKGGIKDQPDFNTSSSDLDNIVTAVTLAGKSPNSKTANQKPPSIAGYKPDVPSSTDEITNEQEPIADNTVMINQSPYAEALKLMRLSEDEPSEPNIQSIRPIPITSPSSIKVTRVQRETLPSPTTTTSIDYLPAAKWPTTFSLDSTTVSSAETKNLDSPRPEQFIRGMSQPFPPSQALGGYPRYPYNQKSNYISGKFNVMPSTGHHLQSGHVRFTTEDDLGIRTTRGINYGNGDRSKNFPFRSMTIGSGQPVRKEMENGKKARKKAISKSMISAPIGPVVKDERRAISEIIVSKNRPSKENIWSKALGMIA